MEQSMYFNQVKGLFAPLASQVGAQIIANNANYLFRQLLNVSFSVDGKWASVLAKRQFVTADIVSLDSSLPLKSREAVEKVNGEIPKMGLKMYLKESEVKNIDALIALNTDGKYTNVIMNRIFQDVPKVIVAIYETIEAILQSELSSGIGVAPAGTGTGVRIDLNFDSANKKGVTAAWNTSSGKAISDVQRVVDKAVTDGNTITDVYADDVFLNAFYANEQVRQQYAFQQGIVGATVPTLEFEQAASIFSRKWGIVLHRVAKTFRSQLNGTTTSSKSWANGVASFICDAKIGDLVWTPTVESTRPKEGVEYQEVDDFILVSKYADNDPWREFTSSQAMVVPILNNIDRIYLLDSQTVQA